MYTDNIQIEMILQLLGYLNNWTFKWPMTFNLIPKVLFNKSFLTKTDHSFWLIQNLYCDNTNVAVENFTKSILQKIFATQEYISD